MSLNFLKSIFTNNISFRRFFEENKNVIFLITNFFKYKY